MVRKGGAGRTLNVRHEQASDAHAVGLRGDVPTNVQQRASMRVQSRLKYNIPSTHNRERCPRCGSLTFSEFDVFFPALWHWKCIPCGWESFDFTTEEAYNVTS